MAGRPNPFRELDELIERMNRQFGELSGGFESQGMLSEVSVDVADQGDQLVVTADLPGFSGDDIDLRVDRESLTISAEYESEETEESDQFHRQERRRESVRRQLPLPEAVDAPEASASYNNGVLTVTLPKLDPETSSGYQIDVE
ncbi:Hsp20/alpha crystallin family protein [Halohasta litorea]|uniref:Hsp20/alpha crystallin family protein n=1 Tax=Halohasta litorea TaxID=869891 RepID=A0ABD6D510_9EURY|nr:Hsp20/alpha crystallin family protein [Halohasta litorea]